MNSLDCYDHVRGEFIGYQHNPFKPGKMAMFNCAICGSTFSVTIETEYTRDKFKPMDVLQEQFQLNYAQ